MLLIFYECARLTVFWSASHMLTTSGISFLGKGEGAL